MRPPVTVKGKTNRLKLEGAREMAGATAREVERPLTVINCLLERLMDQISPDDPIQESLRTIAEEIFRIGELAKRINNVWRYETVEATNGVRIIDIDKSVAPCIERDRICYRGEQWIMPHCLHKKVEGV